MTNIEYNEFSDHVLRGLDEAIKRCFELLRETPPPTDGQRSQINIEIKEISFRYDKVVDEMLAVAQSKLTVRPPSTEDLLEAKKIADKLEKLTAGTMTISAVTDGATEIMNIWKTKIGG